MFSRHAPFATLSRDPWPVSYTPQASSTDDVVLELQQYFSASRWPPSERADMLR